MPSGQSQVDRPGGLFSMLSRFRDMDFLRRFEGFYPASLSSAGNFIFKDKPEKVSVMILADPPNLKSAAGYDQEDVLYG